MKPILFTLRVCNSKLITLILKFLYMTVMMKDFTGIAGRVILLGLTISMKMLRHSGKVFTDMIGSMEQQKFILIGMTWMSRLFLELSSKHCLFSHIIWKLMAQSSNTEMSTIFMERWCTELLIEESLQEMMVSDVLSFWLVAFSWEAKNMVRIGLEITLPQLRRCKVQSTHCCLVDFLVCSSAVLTSLDTKVFHHKISTCNSTSLECSTHSLELTVQLITLNVNPGSSHRQFKMWYVRLCLPDIVWFITCTQLSSRQVSKVPQLWDQCSLSSQKMNLCLVPRPSLCLVRVCWFLQNYKALTPTICGKLQLLFRTLLTGTTLTPGWLTQERKASLTSTLTLEWQCG